ncbi:MAG: flagellar export chaperone FliS [Magnetococcales bacterium]|nr:flagellar export chaperone FliS [Magnetococcales bacterium]
MSYGLQRYQSARANTASKEEILLMLYEGAVRFLERSIAELEAGNFAEHKNFLRRGRAIIEEFQNTLDFEKGGELALQLFDLYGTMLDFLSQANIRRDAGYIRRVINMLNTLLEGWRGAVAQVKMGGGEVAPPAEAGSVRRDV